MRGYPSFIVIALKFFIGDGAGAHNTPPQARMDLRIFHRENSNPKLRVIVTSLRSKAPRDHHAAQCRLTTGLGENLHSLSDPRRLTDLVLSERYDGDRFAWMESERMANISGDLVAKIDERRRKLDQVDQAIAEMRRLQQGREAAAIAPRKSAGRILLLMRRLRAARSLAPI